MGCRRHHSRRTHNNQTRLLERSSPEKPYQKKCRVMQTVAPAIAMMLRTIEVWFSVISLAACGLRPRKH